MTSVNAGQVDEGPDPESLGPGIWRIGNLAQARRVCADDTAFRAARPTEYVPGVSRSFFLATDAGTPVDRTRFRNVLAAALAPRRLDRLTDEVLQPTAQRLARQLPLGRTVDLTEEFVRPYTRQVAYRLAGLPGVLGVELAAIIKVAAELAMSTERPDAVQGLLSSVWTSIEDAVAGGDLASDSLPGFALARGLIREREVPLLLVPILEMAVLDFSSALTIAAVARMSGLVSEAQSALQDAGAARNFAWAAATDLEGLNVTRVAQEATMIGAVPVPVGARLVLDVSAANQQACPQAAPSDDTSVAGDHLAFGHGTHACMGRGLALAVAAVAVSELAWCGWLSATSSPQDGYRLDVMP